MFPVLLLLHVLGATVWVGGHLVLALGYLPGALRTRDLTQLRAFESRFERIGIPALIVMVLTGPELARHYVPAKLWFSFDGPMASHVGAKFILLGATIVLALHARLRLVPKADTKLGALAAHIIAITVIALALVFHGVTLRLGGSFSGG